MVTLSAGNESVGAYIDAVASPIRRRDAHTLLELIGRITGEAARLWGPSIIGFGSYHYRYASGREGDAPAAGFSPRKAASTVYLPDGVGAYPDQLARLGEHTTGVGCLYLKDLEKIDLGVLEEIIGSSFRTVTSGVFGQRARESGQAGGGTELGTLTSVYRAYWATNPVGRTLPTMGTVIYSLTVSLDGYSADENGNFDWSAPDEEVHAFVNDTVRPIGTFLFGRRMYETMLYWESADAIADQPAVMRDFAAIWQAAEKIVYSSTLTAPTSANTRLERHFDPEAIRRLKASAPRDLGVGGPGLAAHAIRAGLVDEIHLFVVPIVLGGGTAALPPGIRFTLELLDEHRFGSGTVYLRYRVVH